MQEVFKIIGQFAASDATVMITGESGTGKELIARCLMQHSLRSNREFVAVNCAAIPENLIESELFGHEKGSFTGAMSQRIGRFEQCDGGTIFLDEIGDMDLPTQTKILRVLQEGEIQRVGGNQTIKVDVRVIAATNKDLEQVVEDKTFREDLYYRLNVVRIRVPPLRERVSDIPEIVEFMLQNLEKERKSKVRRVSPEAMDVLRKHNWPGNVRELENVVYRSAVVAQGDTILIKDLPPELRDRFGSSVANPAEPAVAQQAVGQKSESANPSVALVEEKSEDRAKLLDQIFSELSATSAGGVMKTLEGEMVRRALNEAAGDQVRAAKLLGLTRNVLKKRIEELDL
jgi:two-component system nitrogen regulation response regulator GlnG